MTAGSPRNKPYHPAWRLVAILVFAGLFVLGISMVFRHPGRDLPETDRVGPAEATESEIERAESVEQGLTFTEQEQQILDTVRDYSQQRDEPPLYLILRRAAALPELPDAELSALGAPSYADLLEYPSRYRARPLRMRVVPWSVRRLTAGKGLGRSSHWPTDRPVWEIHGINVGAGPELKEEEPVILFSVVDPTPIFGEPDETAEGGRKIYYSQPPIDAAGVFYKILTAESRAGDELNYPVVAAWQLRRSAADATPGTDMLQALVLMVVVALLLIMFFYMRRRSQGQSSKYPTYQPRRPTEDTDTDEDDLDEQDEQEEQMDPELIEAVKHGMPDKEDEDSDGDRSSG